MTACAMVTNRIKLGTSVLSVFVRSPSIIGMGAANIDYLSQGRFILGLGSSHKVQVEGQHGLHFERPLTRLQEVIAMLQTLFANGSVSYHGKVFNLERFGLASPIYRPRIPIYLAGVNPKLLEMCGAVADGNIGLLNTVEKTRETVGHLEQGLSNAGRDPSGFEKAAIIHCCVRKDADEAMHEMRQHLAYTLGCYPRYNKLLAEAGFEPEAQRVRQAWLDDDLAAGAAAIPDAAVARLTATGTPSQVHDRLDEYRAAGLTLPILLMPGKDEKASILELIHSLM
jgi:alkanesulfonate monooxygenase SsuD/methylene tetrahydromethanopterin reductase-like flavin-dependent oxidoreductase (luciferase family)